MFVILPIVQNISMNEYGVFYIYVHSPDLLSLGQSAPKIRARTIISDRSFGRILLHGLIQDSASQSIYNEG
jgi:hypothetical protein